ncbi:glycosyltransferase [Chloroflexia bacterium SDU3-3]|nr:glycosyltransferase [Chloroflexia bacterium SDU3-3]
MHIAVVTTYPPSAGTLNEYAYHFVRCLLQKPEAASVTLLVDELPHGAAYPQPEDTEGKLQIIPCWRFGDMRNAARISTAIGQIKPDVVLFNIQFASFGGDKIAAALGLSAPMLVKAMGYTTIVLMHNIMETVDLRNAGYGSSRLSELLIRSAGSIITRMLLSADLVALTIPKYVEILERKYGAHNVLLAPHGAFEQIPPPALELKPGPAVIMTFGKFGTYKKIETLIEAFKLLQLRNTAPVQLVIAGTDSPNAKGYLESVRQQYADVTNIRFTGYVAENDVPQLFGDAAVVVFPYTSTTGSSGVLHQAGNYGKAVVLPQLGDLAELIEEEGYSGEFFTPDDPTSLASAIASVLDDDTRRQHMGMRNYLAACGLPMADVVDWYLLHAQLVLEHTARPAQAARSIRVGN